MSIPNHLEPFHELSPTDPTDLDLPKTTGHRHHTLRTHSTGFNTQSHASVARQQLNIASGITSFHRLPLSNFRYFLTLFSKFFSSFAHATCSLSVFRQYLALDEVYHPFRAAIPNNPTLWLSIVRGELRVKDGIITLYDPLFQGSYTRVTTDTSSLDYNSMP